MSEVESVSSLRIRLQTLYHPGFIYTSNVPSVFILFPYQLCPRVIQEPPSEDLFEAEGDTELSPLEHFQL